MFNKFKMSDKEYDMVCKGIIDGVIVGTLVGTILGDVSLFFSLGGVVGIIISTGYNMYKRYVRKKFTIKIENNIIK